MSKRTRRSQTCHNNSILRRAVGLEANGWKVKADIQGFKRPPVLNHSRPDIIATKGKRRRIIEVETTDTRFRDRPQHRKLREYARNHRRTEFNVRTCYM
ncbi:MAG TPA: hypothetical protein VJ771_05690 [Candidatus Nitrosotalea sp.]|nr:hypothetical protein [Candidatus Nitrosotalea sp.]